MPLPLLALDSSRKSSTAKTRPSNPALLKRFKETLSTLVATFSQRYGYTSIEAAFQRERADERLRTRLWNVLVEYMWGHFDRHVHYSEARKRINSLIDRLWVNYLGRDSEEHPYFDSRCGHVKSRFKTCAWYEMYDLLEFLLQDETTLLGSAACLALNTVLEEENAAYRVVGTQIVEVTDKSEIAAIEEGLAHPDDPVRTHIESAVRLLSDRKVTNYRNSIKESISAVESMCCRITGRNQLGEAIKKIENLHPSLRDGFLKLYGFTWPFEVFRVCEVKV